MLLLFHMKKLSTVRLSNVTKVIQLIRGSLSPQTVLLISRKSFLQWAGRNSDEVSESQGVESLGSQIKELLITDDVKDRKSRVRRVSGQIPCCWVMVRNYCCIINHPQLSDFKQQLFILLPVNLAGDWQR